MVKVGFVPGEVYSPPKAPPPPEPERHLSDLARCLIAVNDYCEMAALRQKYLRLGGAFDAATQDWKIQNRGALQSMLASAEQSAKRGIALANKAGIDASMLTLLYEHATRMKASEDDLKRLEALRQYWRCAMLGSFAWQLSAPQQPEPRPAPAPAPAAPPTQPPPTVVSSPPPPPSQPAEPVESGGVTVYRYDKQGSNAEEVAPVEALPVSIEEIEEDMANP